MDLCVYHETTEAVAVCPVCKQGICDKCLGFGQDGMCGMCVEIAAARKATNEASRAARQEAAEAAKTRPAATPAPAGRPAPTAKVAGGSGGPLPGPPKPAARAGMCQEHPDRPAKAVCSNCAKRVCPYCLDLYDLCVDCRLLPHCVRHESMVGSEKCVGCKMSFCKICLNGTDSCDRCRTLRAATGQAPRPNKASGGTGPLKAGATGAKSPTQSLQRTPTGPLSNKSQGASKADGGGASDKAAAVAARYGQGARSKNAGAQAGAKKAGPPWPIIGGVAGVLVLFLVVHAVMGGKPSLSAEESAVALHAEMGMVQKAAATIQAHSGSYPETSAAILDELKAEGINAGDLPLTLKLSVNTPPTEPLTIGYTKVGESFQIRALDSEGRPLSDAGRDIVLGPPPARVERSNK